MRITAVKTFAMRAVERNWLFVKVETDDGLYGWGEASLELKESTVERAIHDLAPYLVGQDPTRIEHLWQVLYRHSFWRGGVVLNTAISGLDQALWDITGKAYGQPVYKLLGGPVRDRVRLYAHGGPAEAPAILEAGFTGIKMGSSATHQRPDERAARELADTVRTMREKVGPEVDIMIDNHGKSRPGQAMKLIRAVDELGLLFFEEPTPPDNVETLRRLAEAGFTTDLATGERLYTRWGFRELIERQLVAVIQPDLCHAGGISECRKIAAAAETYHIQVAPHNPYGPVATAASVHLAAAIPNFLILEYVWTSEPWRSRIQKGEPVSARRGFIELPTAPGLGLDLDEELLRSRPAEPNKPYGQFSDDGAVADI